MTRDVSDESPCGESRLYCVACATPGEGPAGEGPAASGSERREPLQDFYVSLIPVSATTVCLMSLRVLVCPRVRDY